jgi:hypothetical protein
MTAYVNLASLVSKPNAAREENPKILTNEEEVRSYVHRYLDTLGFSHSTFNDKNVPFSTLEKKGKMLNSEDSHLVTIINSTVDEHLGYKRDSNKEIPGEAASSTSEEREQTQKQDANLIVECANKIDENSSVSTLSRAQTAHSGASSRGKKRKRVERTYQYPIPAIKVACTKCKTCDVKLRGGEDLNRRSDADIKEAIKAKAITLNIGSYILKRQNFGCRGPKKSLVRSNIIVAFDEKTDEPVAVFLWNPYKRECDTIGFTPAKKRAQTRYPDLDEMPFCKCGMRAVSQNGGHKIENTVKNITVALIKAGLDPQEPGLKVRRQSFICKNREMHSCKNYHQFFAGYHVFRYTDHVCKLNVN